MANQDRIPEGRAIAKDVWSSPSKVRRSVDLIRGKQLNEARRLLAFSPWRGARLVSKVLESAAANAVNNHDLDEDALYVHRTFVDQGRTYKRREITAYGRIGIRRRRTCHITVVVRGRSSS